MHACMHAAIDSQLRNSKAKKKKNRQVKSVPYSMYAHTLHSQYQSWYRKMLFMWLQLLGLITRWNYIVQRSFLKQRNLRQFWNHPCRALSLPPLHWSISTNVQLHLEIGSNAISWSSMQWILPSSSLLLFYSFSSYIAALHMYIVVWLSFSRTLVMLVLVTLFRPLDTALHPYSMNL